MGTARLAAIVNNVLWLGVHAEGRLSRIGADSLNAEQPIVQFVA